MSQKSKNSPNEAIRVKMVKIVRSKNRCDHNITPLLPFKNPRLEIMSTMGVVWVVGCRDEVRWMITAFERNTDQKNVPPGYKGNKIGDEGGKRRWHVERRGNLFVNAQRVCNNRRYLVRARYKTRLNVRSCDTPRKVSGRARSEFDKGYQLLGGGCRNERDEW